MDFAYPVVQAASAGSFVIASMLLANVHHNPPPAKLKPCLETLYNVHYWNLPKTGWLSYFRWELDKPPISHFLSMPKAKAVEAPKHVFLSSRIQGPRGLWCDTLNALGTLIWAIGRFLSYCWYLLVVLWQLHTRCGVSCALIGVLTEFLVFYFLYRWTKRRIRSYLRKKAPALRHIEPPLNKGSEKPKSSGDAPEIPIEYYASSYNFGDDIEGPGYGKSGILTSRGYQHSVDIPVGVGVERPETQVDSTGAPERQYSSGGSFASRATPARTPPSHYRPASFTQKTFEPAPADSNDYKIFETVIPMGGSTKFVTVSPSTNRSSTVGFGCPTYERPNWAAKSRPTFWERQNSQTDNETQSKLPSRRQPSEVDSGRYEAHMQHISQAGSSYARAPGAAKELLIAPEKSAYKEPFAEQAAGRRMEPPSLYRESPDQYEPKPAKTGAAASYRKSESERTPLDQKVKKAMLEERRNHLEQLLKDWEIPQHLLYEQGGRELKVFREIPRSKLREMPERSNYGAEHQVYPPFRRTGGSILASEAGKTSASSALFFPSPLLDESSLSSKASSRGTTINGEKVADAIEYFLGDVKARAATREQKKKAGILERYLDKARSVPKSKPKKSRKKEQKSKKRKSQAANKRCPPCCNYKPVKAGFRARRCGAITDSTSVASDSESSVETPLSAMTLGRASREVAQRLKQNTHNFREKASHRFDAVRLKPPPPPKTQLPRSQNSAFRKVGSRRKRDSKQSYLSAIFSDDSSRDTMTDGGDTSQESTLAVSNAEKIWGN